METQAHAAQPAAHKPKMSWTTFFLMIAVSTVIMYGLMYLNTFQLDHIFFSQTRMWMALYMGAVMAAVMLAFMWKMYPGEGKKIATMAGSAAVFVAALWLVRSQETVDDVSWMKAMIPHHSIAVLTSSRANIHDPRARALADRIIEAQVKEIEEMKLLIADIDANGVRGNGQDLPPRSAQLTPQLKAEAAAAVR